MTMDTARLCRKCQQFYEPSYYDVMGLHLLRGDGFCQDCAQKAYDDAVPVPMSDAQVDRILKKAMGV